MSKIIGYLQKVLPAVGIILLIYLIYKIGIEKISSTLFSMQPRFVLLASLILIPRLLMDTYKWRYIQQKQYIDIPFSSALKIYLIGLFYSAVTPSGIGNFLRIIYLKQKSDVSLGKSTTNVILDAVLETIALFSVAALGAFIFMGYIPNLLPATLGVLILFITLFLFFIKKHRGKKLFTIFSKFLVPAKYREKLRVSFDSLYEDMPQPKTLIIPFIVGFSSWLILYTQMYIIALSLSITIPFLYFIMLYPVGFIIGLLPITIGGLGTREGAIIFLFSIFGVAAEKSFVLSLAGYAVIEIFPAIIGAVFSIYEGKKTYTADKKG